MAKKSALEAGYDAAQAMSTSAKKKKTCPTALHPDERELRLAAAKAQMGVAFAHFERNPNADHWTRLQTLMAEYQDLKCNVHSVDSLVVKYDAILLRSPERAAEIAGL
jgi:hypothetical protein